MNILGKRIRALRKQHNMTQKELGNRLTLGESTIGMYERGARQPDYAILVQIADIFDVNTDYLLGREVDDLSKEINKYLKEQDIDDQQIKDFMLLIMSQSPQDRERLRKIVEAYADIE